MVWQLNAGHMPPECELLDESGNRTGYRSVHVKLFNGWNSKAAGGAPWPAAGGRPPTRWGISPQPHPFEIKAYEVI